MNAVLKAISSYDGRVSIYIYIYIYIISTFYFVLLDSFTLLLQQEDVKTIASKTSGSVHHPQCDA